jgi:hypothetical protein
MTNGAQAPFTFKIKEKKRILLEFPLPKKMILQAWFD